MVFHLLLPGIHEQCRSSLQAYTGKSLTLAQEDFLLSLEYFSVALVFYVLAVVVGYIEKQEGMLKPSLWILTKMEQYSFSLGRPRQETKQQKKERIRKQKLEKMKEARRKANRTKPFVPLPVRPPWLLLPKHLYKDYEFWILTLKGDTYWSKKQDVLCQIEHAQTPHKAVFGFPETIGEAHRTSFVTKANIVLDLLYQNQVLRWKFKNFLNKVRILRFSKVNTTDPITLEPFKYPVSFPSFKQQKIFTFEAGSFIKHCHKKLLDNEGEIPAPQFPKNPLTNEKFTLTQLMGLLDQCRQVSQTSWAIEALIECQYDITTFVAVHTKPLRLHAIRTTMANVSSWDAIDILYDFIKSQYLFHKKAFLSNTYRWAITYRPHHPKLNTWRKLCLKWYETDILIEEYDTKETFLKVISDKTFPLCTVPHDLQVLRKLSLKSQDSSDGSSSPRDTESEG
jgi:hypothetical protein